jgi:hypothetical protein
MEAFLKTTLEPMLAITPELDAALAIATMANGAKV